jgi:antitoxin (DNA-binding transcriptional repressor) of toxin-antitoxin stability system
MGKTVSATEAVRKFSEILNSVRYQWESYTILRGGKPIASISPVETSSRKRFLGELREMVKDIPHLGAEGDRFGRDLRGLLKHQPPMPKEDKWA